MTDPTPDRETQDASELEAALQNLIDGQLVVAEQKLADIAARAPDDWARSWEQDGKLHIRFWSQDEFVHYVTKFQPQQSVVWMLNAYPRACYYLGLVRFRLNDPHSALEALNRGLSMEPTHPFLLSEKAKATASLRRHEVALQLYRQAAEAAEDTLPFYLGLALRGQAIQLIELGQLDEAESTLLRSLEVDPESQLARDELSYIAHLRAGGASSHMEVSGLKTVLAKCGTCGGPLSQTGAVGLDAKGSPTYTCEQCEKKSRKRWWEFWK